MRLIIVRHGIAIDRDDPKCPSEPERYLTKEGIERTTEAAKGFSKLKPKPGLVLSSPYTRAIQTAEIFCKALKIPKKKIQKTPALLPNANPGDIFVELAGQTAGTVICFGHAPNVDRVVAHAVGCANDITEMKKAGIAEIDLRAIEPPSGSLQLLLTPKALTSMKRVKAERDVVQAEEG